MNKVLTMVVLAGLLSACAYDPVNYQNLRLQENAQHNRLMG